MVGQHGRVTTTSRSQSRATQTPRSKEITYPHVVSRGSVRVTIYRINNPARGEVFEVTWFKEGQRTRKTFRVSEEALEHAAETAKALDSGKGDSLALGGAELEGFRLAKKTLASLVDPPPLHSAIQEFVAARKLLGNKPILPAIEKYLADATSQQLKPITVSGLDRRNVQAQDSSEMHDQGFHSDPRSTVENLLR